MELISAVIQMGMAMFIAAYFTKRIVTEINLMMKPLFKKFGKNAVDAEKSIIKKQFTYK